MTPAARIAAAAAILDQVLAGSSAEQTLTAWARKSRFAGSGDRAAVRDFVFDALRRKRSLAWLGGAETGRGLMLGALRAVGQDPIAYFTGGKHDLPPLSATESAAPDPIDHAPDPVRHDVQDWLWPLVGDALGDTSQANLTALQSRAPVFLRVNTAKTTPAEAIAELRTDEIIAIPSSLSPSALVVTGNPRRIKNSSAYRTGLVELQDAASQAVVDVIVPYARSKSVLDYCAGGGGKALHLAASGAARVVAHDANPDRMRDIPVRAVRGGHKISVSQSPKGQFDCVLLDVPCSGSGAWRRQPEAKWRLTPERLAELNGIQDEILQEAVKHVSEDGVLAYVTCSFLRPENDERIDAFCARHPEFETVERRQFTPLDGGDGFFVVVLKRRGLPFSSSV